MKTVADIKSAFAAVPGRAGEFWEDSLLKYLIDTPPKDSLKYLKYFARNQVDTLKFGKELIGKLGFSGVVRLVKENPWIANATKGEVLTRKLTKGRSGRHLESILMMRQYTGRIGFEVIGDMFYDPSRMLIINVIMQPDLFQAMGLTAYNLDGMALQLPMMVPEAVVSYIDEAENEGINPDACSLPKATMGMVKKGHLPKGCAIVTSNLPCDAGLALYNYVQPKFELPIYYLEVPFDFYSDRADKLFAEDLKGLIAFLEEKTPGRMDWDKFREICETRNRMMELELELWDTLRARPAPLTGEAIWMTHNLFLQAAPGSELGVELFGKLIEIAKANLREQLPATTNERYRTMVWNAPFFQHFDIFNWAERTYGLTTMIDSLSYNRHEFIDTSTPETMLSGWGKINMQAPMVRHNRGPAENYLDDIFRAYKQFDLDMIWVANHVGCKSAQSINGVLREQCREKGIPLLILDYDLLDPRITSHESMKRQVEDFMENIMKAPRLDQ